MTPGTHGSTFGGNLLAMAAVNATLDIMLAPGFFDHVKRIGLLFKQRLAEIKDRYPTVIAEVRGEGLLIGLRAVVPAGELVDAMRGEKVITVAAGDNVVRLLPPLIISEQEMAEGIARLDRACAKLAQAHARSKSKRRPDECRPPLSRSHRRAGSRPAGDHRSGARHQSQGPECRTPVGRQDAGDDFRASVDTNPRVV